MVPVRCDAGHSPLPRVVSCGAMKWLLLGSFVACTPSCQVVEAFSAWFRSPDGAEQVGEGIVQVMMGDTVGGIWTILGGLGVTGAAGYGVYRKVKRARARLNAIEPEEEPSPVG